MYVLVYTAHWSSNLNAFGAGIQMYRYNNHGYKSLETKTFLSFFRIDFHDQKYNFQLEKNNEISDDGNNLNLITAKFSIKLWAA